MKKKEPLTAHPDRPWQPDVSDHQQRPEPHNLSKTALDELDRRLDALVEKLRNESLSDQPENENDRPKKNPEAETG